MAQWYSKFYWKNKIPNPFTAKQMKEILQRQENTCAFANCNEKLQKKYLEFFHILSYFEQEGSRTGYGFAICKKCHKNITHQNQTWSNLCS